LAIMTEAVSSMEYVISILISNTLLMSQIYSISKRSNIAVD